MPMTTIRTARRPRRCDRDCGVPIRAGEEAEHVAIESGKIVVGVLLVTAWCRHRGSAERVVMR